MSVLLFILSFILVVLLAPIGLAITTAKSCFFLDMHFLFDYYRDLAISLDQFGNVAMKGLFNEVLIKSYSKNKFGNPDETISSVLGKNKVGDTLTDLGRALDWLLNEIDEDHSIKSIEEDE